MATLDHYPLPPESIPHVLQVWRYSTNPGQSFTIRQAKWVSRLYVPFPELPHLWFHSRRYAKEEETQLLSGKAFDSYSLDILSMRTTPWERSILGATDAKRPVSIWHSLIPIADDGRVIEELLHESDLDHLEKNKREFDRHFEMCALLSKEPSSTNYFTELEPRLVYLRLLSYLSKSPKWKKMNPEQTRDVILSLR